MYALLIFRCHGRVCFTALEHRTSISFSTRWCRLVTFLTARDWGAKGGGGGGGLVAPPTAESLVLSLTSVVVVPLVPHHTLSTLLPPRE